MLTRAPFGWRSRRGFLTALFLLALARTVWKTLRLISADRDLVDARLVEERQTVRMDLEDAPRVSVLVAAWNESANLPRFIESFCALPYPDRELVLCAGGIDGSFAIASRSAGPSIRVVEQQAGDGKQGALRRCLSVATGDIVFLTDADCVLSADPFLRTLSPLIREGEAAAEGTYAPSPAQRQNPLAFYRWCFDNFAYVGRGRYLSAGSVNGVNFAIRRSALIDADGFGPEVSVGEDYHLASRLLQKGYRIRGVPASEVECEYATSIAKYVPQVARWQRSTILLAARFGQISEAQGVLRGLVAGVGFFILPLVVPFLGLAAVYAWVWLLLNSWGQRWRYFLITRRLRPAATRGKSVLPALAFVVLDLAASALAVVQILRPSRRDEW